jgi:hypothetical protein
MQTFVPYADFRESARALDMRRLGKQRVETLQIIQSLMPITGRKQHGWRNHPATKMWQENIAGLAAYGVAICDEWISRGYKDTCREKISAHVEPDELDLPEWWGDNRVHESHKSNLLRKNFDFYSRYDWGVSTDIPYFWPIG